MGGGVQFGSIGVAVCVGGELGGGLGGGKVSTLGKAQVKAQPVPTLSDKIRIREAIRYFMFTLFTPIIIAYGQNRGKDKGPGMTPAPYLWRLCHRNFRQVSQCLLYLFLRILIILQPA